MTLRNFTIKGPELSNGKLLWEAEKAEIVEWSDAESLALGGEDPAFGGHFADTHAIRNLLVDRNENLLSGSRKFLLPGTIVALCRIHKVDVNIGKVFTWGKTGDSDNICHALLLLQSNAADWLKGAMVDASLNMPDCVCIGGEINLSLLRPPSADISKPIESLTQKKITSVKEIRLNASGLLFEADCSFEWKQLEKVKAPFWMAPFVGKENNGALYVSVDTEQMNADKEKWKPSMDQLQDIFRELATCLRQKENDEKESVYWTSLEPVNAKSIPSFYWTVPSTAGSITTLDFPTGEWRVIIADQSPSNAALAPRGMFTIAPEIQILASGQTITLKFSKAIAPPNAPGLVFNAGKTAGQWTEDVNISGVTTQYEPLSTATILRDQYKLLAPEDDAVADPPVLWGCMPLTNGWAQLPFLNLVETHYFKAFENNQETASGEQTALFNGAAVFGNDSPSMFTPENGENPWSITLLNGSGYDGLWTIDAASRELTSHRLTIFNPELVLHGFFKLGVQSPVAADALPSLDNFLGELVMLPLSTAQKKNRFPSPFRINFPSISFSNKKETRRGTMMSTPLLQQWNFHYSVNNENDTFKKLLQKGIWNGKDDDSRFAAIWKYLPLAWCRHHAAPLIQCLPLTQQQMPPSYPSASRQLAPFEFSVENTGLENLFGIDANTGAKDWPAWLNLSQAKPSRDWPGNLGLASLSLPGLVFDPKTSQQLLSKRTDFTGAQMLYSLPYTEEINALAQLPKEEKQENNDQPEEVVDKPVLIPRRESYAEHWQQLAEKAVLAKGDADEMLELEVEKTNVINLVEPFAWPVKATLELDNYPGKIELANAQGDQSVTLKDEDALKGISGKFVINQKELKLIKSDDPGVTITAGSMAAFGDGKRLRDQRGWWRGASTADIISGIIRTPMQRQTEQDEDFELCTLSTPVALSFVTGPSWLCWFRDLPFKADTFKREDEAQGAEDVNDTNAVSSRKNALRGYEWRLMQQTDDPLMLLGFYFFPLTLEKVVIQANEVQSVDIIGRVQLPFPQHKQQLPELGNVVRVKFVRTAGSLKIQSVSSTLQGGAAPQQVNGILSLDPQKNNFAPRLHWKIFEYTATTNKIDIDCLLEFYLFGERWFVPLEDNDIESGKPAEFKGKIELEGENISMTVAVKLDAAMLPVAVKITMQFTWGDGASLKAVAEVAFDLLTTQFPGNVIDLITPGITTNFYWNIPGKPVLNVNKGWLDHRSLQLSFSGFKNNAHKTLELLPGMLLDDVSGEPSAGFASASFFVNKDGVGKKTLKLNHACVEAVFNCRWGAGPLSSSSPAVTAEHTIKEVFGSSSGNLNAGYTLNYTEKKWTVSFLLNGMIDVNNLVSYPRSALNPQIELPVILFNSNLSVIKPSEEEKLRKVAEQMKLFPELTLSIEGHTDNTGAVADNFDLSRKRAIGVKARLKKILKDDFGIPEATADKRLTVAWFGETLPDSPSVSNNRRVEIHCSFTALPAIRPAGNAGDLNHIRHTLRILFNQHEIDSKALTAGSGIVLFNFKDDAAWQFLAVVEHRLVDVGFRNLSTPLEQSNDRRWTAIQEIRFASPSKFSSYIRYFFDKENKPRKKIYSALVGSPSKQENEDNSDPLEVLSIDAHEFSRISAAFHYKPFIEKLLAETAGQNEITKLNNAILVEASAIQKILNSSNSSNEPLNLQYLPGGIQRAILSVPEDYAMPSITPRRDWALMSLPFLGRLQQAVNDWTGNDSQPASLLAADPILFLHKNIASAQPLPVVPLSLASRGDRKPVPVQISLFDLTRFRRFRRLDPATLMESWFRIQNPPVETFKDEQKLVSVTAALPADSPARLSRETLLKRLYDEQRNSFPPAIGQLLNEDPEVTSDLVWRRNALITWQGFSNIVKEDIHDRTDADTSNNPYSFYFAAAQIHSYRFTGNGKVVDRYPAVTLLPANLKVDGKPNKMPVSFTVSPYLGLDFKVVNDVASDRTPVLIFAELLCLDQTGKRIIPAVSRVWQQEEIIANDYSFVGAWGNDVRSRIAADSPVAVVRIRKVFSSGKEPGMRFPEIEYAFEVLASGEQFTSIAESGGPLRLPLKQLRFSEGQFGGSIAPARPESFEIAPPQVTGVQPLNIDKDKWNLNPDDRKWHWGLSALRMSVKFTDKNKGIIGSDLKQDHRLWWNAVSHQVQYENFREATPLKKFLPANFRARYISTLLPVPATPPLPENFKLLPAEIGPVKQWQPVLPGGLYYLFVGARPGVPFVFRNMLIRQDLNEEGENNNDSRPLVAGGIAVQHRFPRPVALPANPPSNQLTEPAPQNALQTWAWYFESELTVQHRINKNAMPHDNAFVVKDNEAHGLQVCIPQLGSGILPESHDGRFALEFKRYPENVTPIPNSDWNINAELVVPGRQLPLMKRGDLYVPALPEENRQKEIDMFRQFLSDLPHGTAVQLRVTVTPAKIIIGDIANYGQTLVLPLRLARQNKLRDPFAYRYTQFEDPEYNRRLASQAAQTNREVTYKSGTDNKKTELIFAADRREYNATSEGLLALFAGNGIKVTSKVTFKWVNASGIATDVAIMDFKTVEDNSAVLRFSLLEIQHNKSVRLAAGDSLLILLDDITITDSTGVANKLQPLGLKVEIVSTPVTPVPAAAYGLLRRKKGAQPVECVKFAWSPQPSRIELLTPMDLKKGIVRRRAIFQWIDTVRLGAEYDYEIQKITPSGSTHFNLFK